MTPLSPRPSREERHPAFAIPMYLSVRTRSACSPDYWESRPGSTRGELSAEITEVEPPDQGVHRE